MAGQVIVRCAEPLWIVLRGFVVIGRYASLAEAQLVAGLASEA
jgi:hypothetical protein